MTRLAWQVARGVFSLAAIVYLSRKYDLWNSLRTLASVNPGYVLAGTLVLASQVIIAALRWHWVLRGLGAVTPLPRLFQLSYVAAFLNTCLPAGIAGDVARAWLAREDTPLATAVTSVLLDRVVAVLTLLLLAAGVEPLVRQQLAAEPVLAAAVPLFALCGVAGTILLINAARITPLLRALRLRPINSLAAAVDRLSNDARKVFRTGPALAALFACAFGGHLAICLSVYIFAAGLSLDLGLLHWLLIVPLVLFVTALPISLGGWGPREFAMVYLLGLFGIPGSVGLTLSIEFGLCTALASLPGAWLWMTLRRGERAKAGGAASPDAIAKDG
jgi:hypothetical protein